MLTVCKKEWGGGGGGIEWFLAVLYCFRFSLIVYRSLDWCRTRITETYRDFCIFNRAVYYWMIYVVNLSALGIAVHLSWNYLVLSQGLSSSKLFITMLLDVFITSEKFMALLLPIAALQGSDIAYMWSPFRLALSRARSERNEFFWDMLIRHLDSLRYHGEFSGGGNTSWQMLLTICSLYFGLKIGTQDWNYQNFIPTTVFTVPGSTFGTAATIP